MIGNKSFIFRFADVEAREREFCLIKAGEVLPVEPKAFRVLLFLLRNPQKLITKEELLDAVWGETAVSENSLTRAIAVLRRVLGDEARTPRFIETVATVGYRFVCKVEVTEDTSVLAETGGGPNLPREEDFGESPASGGGTPPRNLQAQSAGKAAQKRHWLVAGGAVVAAGLAAAVWYWARPLPPLRVVDYVPITHDGRAKDIAGTDGARLYFNRPYAGQSIGQVEVTGGEIADMPVPLANAGVVDVMPDGSSLLVGSWDGKKTSLWAYQLPAGPPRLITADKVIDSTASAAWSPDGGSLALITGQGNLYRMRGDGTAMHLLSPSPETAYGVGPGGCVAWSPDGLRIRFTRGSRYWEIGADGSGLHPLLPGWHDREGEGCGRWTPDGRFFVFLLRDLLPHSMFDMGQLWVLDERSRLLRSERHEPTQLTAGPIHWADPFPSKDGKKIFARGVVPRGELVRWDAQAREFRPWLRGISAEFLAYSPDGQSLVYVTFPEGILWRANSDGSNAVQLTSPPIYPDDPHWSPDGSRILFFDIGFGSRIRGYLVPSQGGSAEPLQPDDEEGTQFDPVWSPDGRKIIFGSDSPEHGGPTMDLKILDLATHQTVVIRGSDGVYSPRWSPDGRFLAALSTPTLALTVFDFKTQQWRVLAKGWCHWPAWSADGQFVYFFRDSGIPSVYRVRASSGAEERVVDLTGFRFAGAVSSWLGLGPHDTPLLLRDAGTDDIYALTLRQK
jgi:DNA-binding winged helix-turn-helix (wHTH) protein/Tol biopolymer transport system component